MGYNYWVYQILITKYQNLLFFMVMKIKNKIAIKFILKIVIIKWRRSLLVKQKNRDTHLHNVKEINSGVILLIQYQI